MNRLRIIDLINLAYSGNLQPLTLFVWKGRVYTYKDDNFFREDNHGWCISLFEDIYLLDLGSEVEIVKGGKIE